MLDYYRILGVKNSATIDDVKRAYRILARRYHPDINPSTSASQKFREVQEAYQTLSDPDKRQLYDMTADAYQKKIFNDRLKSYSTAQGFKDSANSKASSQSKDSQAQKPAADRSKSSYSHAPHSGPTPWEVVSDDLAALKEGFSGATNKIKTLLGSLKDTGASFLKKTPRTISIVELAISVEDSLKGIRKKVEIIEPTGTRKVSIQIPVGVRDGSILRLKKKTDSEELIVIFRLAGHPFLSIKPKGLIIEVPITLHEALYGAQIKIPGLNDEILVKVPPGTQGGTELRLKGQGIQGKDSPGDLFVRLLVMTPPDANAPGLKEISEKLQNYHPVNIREHLKGSIIGE